MDWEANLATIIKCTDANLEQQFQQFADMTGDLTTYRGAMGSSNSRGGGVDAMSYGQQYAAAAASGPAFGSFGVHAMLFDNIASNGHENSSSGADNIGTTYFRETMASQQRNGNGAFTPESRHDSSDHDADDDDEWRASARAAGPPVSFADDFRKRQERRTYNSKASPTATAHRSSRRDGRDSGDRFESNNSDHDGRPPEFDDEIDSHTARRTSRRAPRASHGGVAYQMYSSPTYDVAQMMEQVRLSLKLEVDARAAIAERQLSALLSLCKASTEELDRLRVEVCANDRQLHTLEQVHAKVRQELTTQKDIAYHLQSMCGKDESWRMQAENQLLELRQLVAATREQTNALHAGAHEKLSRAELLVHFNAAIEPIKAQFNASLQHQAQQVVDVARTASSSSLLLDALTQKVNRGLADELVELRHDLQALKSHVTKMNAVLDTNRSSPESQPPPTPPTPAVDPAREAAKQQAKAQLRADVVADTTAHMLFTMHEQLDAKTRAIERAVDVRVTELSTALDDRYAQQQQTQQCACEQRTNAVATACDAQVRALQQQVTADAQSAAHATQTAIEQVRTQTTASATALVEATAAASQSRQLELLRMIESEQRERKLAVDTLHESSRTTRHALEDQVHAVAHASRTAAARATEAVDARVREAEKQFATELQRVERDVAARIESASTAFAARSDAAASKCDAQLRAVEASVVKLELTVGSLAVAVTTPSKDPTSDGLRRSDAAAGTNNDTNASLLTMETLLRKMQLQLELQTHAQAAHTQAQLQAAQVAQLPFWASSPHLAHGSGAASMHALYSPAPLLALPPLERARDADACVSTPTTSTASLSGPLSDPMTRAALVDASRAPVERMTELPDSSNANLTASLSTPQSSSTFTADPLDNLVVMRDDAAQTPPAPSNATAKSHETASTPTGPAAAPTPPALDAIEKIQQTIAASVKGALAEAELAKQRVESRRRHESETRQQQQSQLVHSQSLVEPAPASQLSAAASSATSASTRVEPKLPTAVPSVRPPAGPSTIAAAPQPHAQLTRASSASSLLPPGSASAMNGARASGATSPTHDVAASSARLRSNSIAGDSFASFADAATHRVPLQAPSPPPLPAQKLSQAPPAGTTTSSTAPLATGLPAGATAVGIAGLNKPPPPPPLLPTPTPADAPAPPRAAVSSNDVKATPVLNGQSPSPRSVMATTPHLSSPSLSASATQAPTLAPSTAPFVSNHSLTPQPQRALDATRSAPPHSVALSPPPTASNTDVDAMASSRSSLPPSTPASPVTTAPSKPATPTGASHVLCTLCRVPIRVDQRTEHELSQCPKRTVACRHCHARVLWSDMSAHEQSCTLSETAAGASPRVAGTNYSNSSGVGGSDQASADELLGGAPTPASALKKCRHCSADVVASDLFDHELRCDKMLKQCPHCLRRQKMSELQEHIESCDCRLVPCPNDCGGKFLQRGIPKHIATRCPNKNPLTSVTASGATPAVVAAAPHVPLHSTTAVTAVVPQVSLSATSSPRASVSTIPPPSSSKPATQAPQPSQAAQSAVTQPPARTSTVGASAVAPATTPSSSAPAECKFCDEEFAATYINAHEDQCDWKPKRCQHCNMVIIARDLARHEAACKTSVKTCPHCNESTPQSALAAHTARCSRRPIKCIRCSQQFPADSIVAHSTTCKFVPGAAGDSTVPTSGAAPNAVAAAPAPLPSHTSAAPTVVASRTGAVGPVSTLGKIPPPPPYPPTSSLMSTAPGAPPPRHVPVATQAAVALSAKTADADESAADRIARRNLALSQLTKSVGAVASSATAVASSTSSTALMYGVSVPEQDGDNHDIDDDDNDGDDDDEDDDDDELTLAQVVAEWNVENVCLWLHEDVGVPEVVTRFQQRQCNGEMLLELTESDLIHDFGITNRVARERILSAIDAIKTSDDFSDDDDDGEDVDEEDDEEDDEEEADDKQHYGSGNRDGTSRESVQTTLAAQRTARASLSEASFMHPRDLLRRTSLPSPQRDVAPALPSSSAMLRRINNALAVEPPHSSRK